MLQQGVDGVARDRRRDGQDLVDLIVGFARLLRNYGLNVALSQVLVACQGVESVGVRRRDDFRETLRATMVSQPEDYARFDEAFAAYWGAESENPFPPEEPAQEKGAGAEERGSDRGPERETASSLPEGDRRGKDAGQAAGNGQQAEEGNDRSAAADFDAGAGSPDEGAEKIQVELWYESASDSPGLSRKDFEDLDEEEVRLAYRQIAKLSRRLVSRLSRRKRTGADRYLDFRRTVIRSIRSGGEVLHLAYRRRKVGKHRVVLLCDISGSMKPYSGFILYFAAGLLRALKNVEVFTFSTGLDRVTSLFRRYPPAELMGRLMDAVKDWHGGTTIGTCLAAFNSGPAREVMGKHTVVIIFSDGWDRGDTGLLESAMRKLRARAERILWLNPYAGGPEFTPACRGMKAALPYVDMLLPAASVESLHRLAVILAGSAL